MYQTFWNNQLFIGLQRVRKAVAYSTEARPMLKYSSTVWDPHQISHIHNLERVKCTAAYFYHLKLQNKLQDVSPTWSRVLGGSL